MDLIDRQAAMELVKDVCDAIMSGCESWYDPETEDEVYKDIREVDAILKCNKEVRIALRNMPSVQPQPVVRCKDCKHWRDSDGVYRRGVDAESKCPLNIQEVYAGTFYCGYAERRTDEQGL